MINLGCIKNYGIIRLKHKKSSTTKGLDPNTKHVTERWQGHRVTQCHARRTLRTKHGWGNGLIIPKAQFLIPVNRVPSTSISAWLKERWLETTQSVSILILFFPLCHSLLSTHQSLSLLRGALELGEWGWPYFEPLLYFYNFGDFCDEEKNFRSKLKSGVEVLGHSEAAWAVARGLVGRGWNWGKGHQEEDYNSSASLFYWIFTVQSLSQQTLSLAICLTS